MSCVGREGLRGSSRVRDTAAAVLWVVPPVHDGFRKSSPSRGRARRSEALLVSLVN